MSIFPVNTYKVRSLAEPSEIVAALNKHVDSSPIMIHLSGHKTFSGSISESGFSFVHFGDSRNSFRPTISGTFSSDSEFTIIDITIKHGTYFYVPLVFMFFFSSLFILNSTLLPLFIALLTINSQEIHKYLSLPYSYYLLLPFGVVFLGYFLGVAFFDSEAYLAEKELTEILSPFIYKSEISGHKR